MAGGEMPGSSGRTAAPGMSMRKQAGEACGRENQQDVIGCHQPEGEEPRASAPCPDWTPGRCLPRPGTEEKVTPGTFRHIAFHCCGVRSRGCVTVAETRRGGWNGTVPRSSVTSTLSFEKCSLGTCSPPARHMGRRHGYISWENKQGCSRGTGHRMC